MAKRQRASDSGGEKPPPKQTTIRLDPDLYAEVHLLHGQVPGSTVQGTLEEAIRLALEFKRKELLAAVKARTKKPAK